MSKFKICTGCNKKENIINELLEVVTFYSNPKTYGNSGNKNMNRVKYNDCSVVSFEVDGFSYSKVNTAGKKARDIISKLKELKVIETLEELKERE